MPRSMHQLKIESLRDLKASCSCGKWSLSSPTFDRQTDEELRDRVKKQHDQHLQAGSLYKRVKRGSDVLYVEVDEEGNEGMVIPPAIYGATTPGQSVVVSNKEFARYEAIRKAQNLE